MINNHYYRPVNNNAGNATRAEALLTFFQSLLPSFNVQDFNNRNNNEEEALVEGAVGGGEQENGGRFDMNQMINRLRDFLTSIEQHFPAAAPANNNMNNNNNNQDEENDNENNNNNNPNIEEFD